MDNHIFRSALSGFNRQDVMEYIERTQKEYADREAELNGQITALQQTGDETRQALDLCREEKDSVTGELADMSQRYEDAKSNWEKHAARNAELQTRVEQRDAAVRELTVESQQLRSKVQSLEEEILGVRREKERVTQLELEAQDRAAAIIAKAEEEAAQIMEQARTESAEMLQQAQSKSDSIRADALGQVESTLEQYRALFDSFENSAAHVGQELRKMGVTAAQLPLNFDHLRQGLEGVLEQAQK